MQITDPIADMLTRIRNANNAKHDTVDVPASNMKKAIAQILLDEAGRVAYTSFLEVLLEATAEHICGTAPRARTARASSPPCSSATWAQRMTRSSQTTWSPITTTTA